jgi:hypothetical protein
MARNFNIRKYPSGHVHIQFLNWGVEYNPVRETWWFMKRRKPGAERGLMSNEYHSFQCLI